MPCYPLRIFLFSGNFKGNFSPRLSPPRQKTKVHRLIYTVLLTTHAGTSHTATTMDYPHDFTVKLCDVHTDDVFRAQVPCSTNLKQVIVEKFRLPSVNDFKLRWKDIEGDLCVLSTSAELKDAVEESQASGKTLTVLVELLLPSSMPPKSPAEFFKSEKVKLWTGSCERLRAYQEHGFVEERSSSTSSSSSSSSSESDSSDSSDFSDDDDDDDDDDDADDQMFVFIPPGQTPTVEKEKEQVEGEDYTKGSLSPISDASAASATAAASLLFGDEANEKKMTKKEKKKERKKNKKNKKKDKKKKDKKKKKHIKMHGKKKKHHHRQRINKMKRVIRTLKSKIRELKFCLHTFESASPPHVGPHRGHGGLHHGGRHDGFNGQHHGGRHHVGLHHGGRHHGGRRHGFNGRHHHGRNHHFHHQHGKHHGGGQHEEEHQSEMSWRAGAGRNGEKGGGHGGVGKGGGGGGGRRIARLVRHVNYAPGECILMPGEVIQKTWTLRNDHPTHSWPMNTGVILVSKTNNFQMGKRKIVKDFI